MCDSAPTVAQRKACWAREDAVRSAFEQCTGQIFVKVRPSFLKNPHTGRNLELDVYCDALKLGCEADGAQHSSFPNAFHRTKEEFDAQQARDRIKEELCKKAGVTLMRVPHDVEFDSIHSYVKSLLRKQKIVSKQ